MKKMAIGLVFTCFIFFSAPALNALILPQMTTEEMVSRADTIVTGKSEYFHFHPGPKGEALYAIVAFKVDEYLKNNLGEKELFIMHIVQERGPDGKKTEAPFAFRADEEVLLFLTEKDNEGFRHVLGLSQGIYLLSQDRQGHKVLMQEMKDVRFFDRTTGKITSPQNARAKLRYEDFKDVVLHLSSSSSR
ncbi:MAG: hypothetical protein ABH845_04645 [Candidatus Omnitrophota bacterium]